MASIFLTLLSDGGLWKSGKSQTESLAEQLACVLRGRLAHLKSSLCFARDLGLQCCLWPHPSPFSWQPQYGNLVRWGAENGTSLIDNNQCVCDLRYDTNMNKTAAPQQSLHWRTSSMDNFIGQFPVIKPCYVWGNFFGNVSSHF